MRPENPTYGVITTSASKKQFGDGEYANYRCDYGYRLAGSAKRYCRYGRWMQEPKCVGKKTYQSRGKLYVWLQYEGCSGLECNSPFIAFMINYIKKFPEPEYHN